MTSFRITDLVDEIRTASSNAISFVDKMTLEAFLADMKTQQAVAKSFVIFGEAANKLSTKYKDYVQQNPQIPWDQMRGMRNQITHGYSNIDMKVVWHTTTVALPALLQALPKA